MEYSLGPGQEAMRIVVTFRPRETNTHIAGFVIAQVELPDGRCLHGDLMPGAWIGDDITAEDFCRGVAELPRPEA
jgi:hypothetical protein